MDTDVNEQGSATQPVDTSGSNAPENNAPSTGEFAIPEAYKDMGWTESIHSVDDLWQQHANAQKLIGKKTIGIPTADSSEQEYEDFYAKVRPENADSYEIDLEDEGDNKLFKDLFFKNGISGRQAKAIVDGYKESVRKVSDGLFSEEGLDKSFRNYMGDDYKDKKDKISNFLKQYAKPSTRDAIEKMPNDLIGLMYGVIGMTMDKYGAKELGTPVSGKASAKETDLAGYIKASKELSLRPHSAQEETDLKIKYGVIKNVKGKN